MERVARTELLLGKSGMERLKSARVELNVLSVISAEEVAEVVTEETAEVAEAVVEEAEEVAEIVIEETEEVAEMVIEAAEEAEKTVSAEA